MISEKESRSIDAVNFCRGEEFASGCFITVIRCGSGLIYFPTENRCPNTICTAEHYNQLIEDMASAKWMNRRGWANDYSFYKRLCEGMNIDTSNKELLKKHCDYSFYDKPLVYTQGSKLMIGMKCLVGGKDELEFNIEYVGVNICVVSFVDDLNELREIAVQNELIHPIKTPEQIKQEKLTKQVESIFNSIPDETDCDKVVLVNIIKRIQAEGYIVEPK